jgi:hypothetical protein
MLSHGRLQHLARRYDAGMSGLEAVLVKDRGIGEVYDLMEDGKLVVTCELAKPTGLGPWELECRRTIGDQIWFGWQRPPTP